MKKLSLFLLFNLYILNAVFSQTTYKVSNRKNLELQISNPFPRIGEDITVNYIISSDSFKSNELHYQSNTLATGKIDLYQETKDTGMRTIGPFCLKVEEKYYKSDSVVIRVFPAIPEIDRGIWIIKTEYKGDQYLVVTQILPKIAIEEKVNTNINQRNGTKESINPYSAYQFAQLDSQFFSKEGISFSSDYYSSKDIRTKSPYLRNETQAICRTTIYRISKTKKYIEPYLITKRDFSNFPKGVELKAITIY